MKNAVIGAAILAVLIGLAGCGQRGPLYLPKPPQADPKPADVDPAESKRR